MKKTIVSLLIIVILAACNTEKKNMMFVQGEVKNLKKGTLYLQKMKDTLAVTVDSIVMDGKSIFTLKDVVESPELYFLSLDKSPGKQISFFGEKGTITINTKLDKFVYGATINGLTNQQLLEEYTEMISKFGNKRLDLIKADFEAKKSGDSVKIDSIENLINGLLKRKYYYTLNFAINHPDNEIAPYLALTELFEANVIFLDTINNSLTPKIKASKYGKSLEEYIANIKRNND